MNVPIVETVPKESPVNCIADEEMFKCCVTDTTIDKNDWSYHIIGSPT